MMPRGSGDMSRTNERFVSRKRQCLVRAEPKISHPQCPVLQILAYSSTLRLAIDNNKAARTLVIGKDCTCLRWLSARLH